MAAIYYMSKLVTVKVEAGEILLCVEDEIEGVEVHAILSLMEAYGIAHALAKAGQDIQRET